MLIETKRIIVCICVLICLAIFACTSEKAETPNAVKTEEESVTPSDEIDIDLPYPDSLAENPKIDIISSEPDQTSWRIPPFVLDRMGDLKGQTIADIGAGVGYFAFRLVKRDANVIAVDILPSSIDFIERTAVIHLSNEELERLTTRLAKPDDPLLDNNEVDKANLMHVIGLIDNKKEYLAKLKKAIKQGGQLIIMDFKMKKLPKGYPPKKYRVYPDQLEEWLYELGYEQVVIDDTTLDYKYILTAIDPD